MLPLATSDEKIKAIAEVFHKFAKGICPSGVTECESGYLLGHLSYNEFLSLLERVGDTKLRLWYHPNQCITTFVLPSAAHESVAWIFGHRLSSFLESLGLVFYEDFKVMSSPRIEIPTVDGGGVHSKEPDLAVYLVKAPPTAEPVDYESNQGPQFVLETSVQHESYDEVVRILKLWTSPRSCASLALGVKVWEMGQDGTRRMTAILAVKDGYFSETEFGTDMTGSSDTICLRIPIQGMFGPAVDLPAAGRDAVFSFDLSFLRKCLLRELS